MDKELARWLSGLQAENKRLVLQVQEYAKVIHSAGLERDEEGVWRRTGIDWYNSIES